MSLRMSRRLGACLVLAVASATLALTGTSQAKPGAPEAPAVPAEPVSPTKTVWGDYAPAIPGDLVVKQPDGSSFKATLTNAEIGGNLEVDGYTVVKQADGWWVYASKRSHGELVPSIAKVGIDAVPAGVPVGVGRHVSVWDDGQGGDIRSQALKQLQIASYQAMADARANGDGVRVFKFPVLMLATWWDADAGQTSPQFQEGNTPEKYAELLDGFGGNPTGTVTEFYFENSYGQFLVEIDVYGPYTSARSVEDRCYYGGIDASEDPADDLDPLDNITAGGGGALGMAAEAVPQADPEVDFSQYDNDGDGTVDFTGLLHSGPDMAATGDPCHTWSHATQVPSPGVPTSDGVTVSRVLTVPEIGLEIGVVAHEMAHALGEPDYYNTAYNSMGTGDWDVMAGGSWFGNPPGSNPTHFHPASRVFQGWITPTIVHQDRKNVALKPRELMPFAGYDATEAQPNIVLVPTKWVQVGDVDETGHEWTEDDVLGLVLDGDRGYVIEGYYVENISRTVNGAPIHEDMTRSPYFDRQALNSGLLVWHFDYHRRSNVINGSNNAQTDPNRPQMDVVEWDHNDNDQELQLGLTRGEPTDVVYGAATGITSGTRALPPKFDDFFGTPQEGLTFSGVVPPAGEDEAEFVVEEGAANYQMAVSVTGTGDCTLDVVSVDENGNETEYGSVDNGFVGETETIFVAQPPPGDYIARVGDFAACGAYEGTVTFEAASGVFDTRGAGDTWSNWSEEPTGWAFTNVRPRTADMLDHAADAPGPETITLDILNIGENEADLSPGFVWPKSSTNAGRKALRVRRSVMLRVPVFNNGGTTVPSAKVRVLRDGEVVATGTVRNLDGYSRTPFRFDYESKSEGPATFTVEIDPTDGVDEVSEGNNVEETTLWVGPRDPKVLVVDDDGPTDSEQTFAGALAALDIPYAIAYDHVPAEQMARFDAVVWEAGLERYEGQMDRSDREAVAEYLEGGGKFLYSSPRAAAALGEENGSTNPFGSSSKIDFLRRYFGVEYLDTDQVGGGIVRGTGDILGNGSFGTDVFPGRPLQDVFGAVECGEEGGACTTTPIAELGTGEDADVIGVRTGGEGFTTAFLGFNLSQLRQVDDTVEVLGSIMDHFGIERGGSRRGPGAPIVYHTQQRNRVSGIAVPIKAVVTRLPAGTPVRLFYRRHGEDDFRRRAMEAGATPGTFQGTIPAAYVTPDGVDYYLAAGEGTDPAAVPKLVHAIGVGLPEVDAPAG